MKKYIFDKPFVQRAPNEKVIFENKRGFISFDGQVLNFFDEQSELLENFKDLSLKDAYMNYLCYLFSSHPLDQYGSVKAAVEASEAVYQMILKL